MDQKFQTSFIPKKPVLETVKFGGNTSGIFYILGEIVFIFAVIISVSTFAYQKFLESQIVKMQSSMGQAKENVQPDLIHELSRANLRFVSAKQVINNHTVVSQFFNLLESLTLQTLRFSDFSYSIDQSGQINVMMTGEARSYSTVALQSDIFSKNPGLKDPQFSNLDLNSNGNVIFTFKTKVNPVVVSYVKLLGTEPSTPQAGVVAPAPQPAPNPAPLASTTVSSNPTSSTSTSTTKKP
jgi:hypothetical protein